MNDFFPFVIIMSGLLLHLAPRGNWKCFSEGKCFQLYSSFKSFIPMYLLETFRKPHSFSRPHLAMWSLPARMLPRRHCGLPPHTCVISYIWTNFPSGGGHNTTPRDVALHIDLVAPVQGRDGFFLNCGKTYMSWNVSFLPFLCVQSSGIKHTHIIVPPLPPFISTNLFINPNWNSVPSLPFLHPGNHYSLCLYEFASSRYFIRGKSYSFCTFVSGLCHSK